MIGSIGLSKKAAVLLAAGALFVVGGVATVPMAIVGGGSVLFTAGGSNCPDTAASASPSAAAGSPTGTASPGTPTPGTATPGTATPRAAARGTASPGHGGNRGRQHGTPGGRARVSAAATTGPGSTPAGTITTVVQPGTSAASRNGIPASYLSLYQEMGRKYGVPWVVLAGIGKVESNHGQTSLPGVRSGQNGFGAAGPMQIGVMGASGNAWGGAPVHPASEQVNGVATDGNGDGIASVYQPADAIAGAAKYLLEHGVLTDVSGAIFAYNHLTSYVQAVLYWAGLYASGGYVVTTAGAVSAPQCLTTTALTTGGATASRVASTVIGFARQQLGKPYQWGGTGPDAFDCSGLVMAAYRAAGITIPRTSQAQWAWGPRIPASQAQPGDLVFFAGSDGTRSSPGHVGLVIGHGLMIEAYATGYPIRIAPYTGRGAVGFTRPWAHSGVRAGSHLAAGS